MGFKIMKEKFTDSKSGVTTEVSFINSYALYYLKNYFITAIIGIVLSTPIIKLISRN